MVICGAIAAMMSTALPLLASGIRRSRASIGWVAGCVLCVTGLILTLSPIGITLGVAALVMAQNEFDVLSLEGGLRDWEYETEPSC